MFLALALASALNAPVDLTVHPTITDSSTGQTYITHTATFKDKHPHIYKVAKKTRYACIFVKPIVEVGGSVAQILWFFK